jgi:hypothetical protein
MVPMTKLSRLVSAVIALALLVSISRTAIAQAQARPTEARVAFRSSEHLAIYRHSYKTSSWMTVGTVTGGGIESSLQRICVAPCDASIPVGTETYAVARTSDGEAYPMQIGAITVPEGPSTVQLAYHDRGIVRGIGRIVLFGGLIGGLVYAGVEVGSEPRCKTEACTRRRLVGAAVGGGIVLGSVVVGGLLIGVRDVVDVNVAPHSHASGRSLPRARELSLRGQL